MLPNELQKEIISLPETDRHTIVLVTGNALRHRRFALRMIEAFGDRVAAWYELDANLPPAAPSTKKPPVSASKGRKLRTLLTRELPRSFKVYGVIATLKRLASLASDLRFKLLYMRYTGRKMAAAEQQLFCAEIDALQKHTSLKPIRLHPEDVHSETFIDTVKQHDPYFFLTLGGPLYRAPLLSTIRGAAINQHAGYSPLYKGSNTIHWALYHRQLRYVANTVHLTNTGADAGGILRRSTPCIFPDDTVETIFLRSVALGTELMIETVEAIIRDKEVTVYKQPPFEGKTYLNSAYNLRIAKAIFNDFRAGWLRSAHYDQRHF